VAACRPAGWCAVTKDVPQHHAPRGRSNQLAVFLDTAGQERIVALPPGAKLPRGYRRVERLEAVSG
jgi:hypothetical protein